MKDDVKSTKPAVPMFVDYLDMSRALWVAFEWELQDDAGRLVYSRVRMRDIDDAYEAAEDWDALREARDGLKAVYAL